MAQTTINNGDSGAVVRGALNTMFGDLYGKYKILTPTLGTTSVTGTTSETVMATYSVPTSFGVANAVLRILPLFSFPNSANNKVFRVRLGGTSGTQFLASTQTTALVLQPLVLIRATAVNAQVGFASGTTTGIGNSTGTKVTGTTDFTSSAQDLVISVALASAAETAVFEGGLVELLIP